MDQPLPTPPGDDPAESDRVLSMAVVRAAERLGLKQKQLASVLGISEASASRLERQKRRLDAGGKEGELAVLFVRLFRSLDAMIGGSEESARKWFQADNIHLGDKPVTLVASVQGLVHVVEYLDAMRAKV